MFLTFLPRKDSFSVAFDPAGYSDEEEDNGNADGADEYYPVHHDRPMGSRKAPQSANHFYAEVRLNPDQKALVLRPKRTLTHYASDWVLRKEYLLYSGRIARNTFVVEEATRFARDIYKLMGWNDRLPYVLTGTVFTGDLASSQVGAVDTANIDVPDAAKAGDLYFDLTAAKVINTTRFPNTPTTNIL